MAASLTSQIFKGHRRGYSQVVIELSHEGFFSLFAVSVPACCELKPKIITATTTTKKSNSKCCSHASRGGGGGGGAGKGNSVFQVKIFHSGIL